MRILRESYTKEEIKQRVSDTRNIMTALEDSLAILQSSLLGVDPQESVDKEDCDKLARYARSYQMDVEDMIKEFYDDFESFIVDKEDDDDEEDYFDYEDEEEEIEEALDKKDAAIFAQKLIDADDEEVKNLIDDLFFYDKKLATKFSELVKNGYSIAAAAKEISDVLYNQSLDEDLSETITEDKKSDWEQAIKICVQYDPFTNYIDDYNQQKSAEKINSELDNQFDIIMKKYGIQSKGVPTECQNKGKDTAQVLKNWVLKNKKVNESLTEELWDSSRVTDLATYYTEKYPSASDEAIISAIKKQMKKEGSKLPSNLKEIDKYYYEIIDDLYDDLNESYFSNDELSKYNVDELKSLKIKFENKNKEASKKYSKAIKNNSKEQSSLGTTVAATEKALFEIEKELKSRLNKVNEDTIKTSDGKWTNKGKEGTHGKFKTKKEADAQRKAMFAQGFKSK